MTEQDPQTKHHPQSWSTGDHRRAPAVPAARHAERRWAQTAAMESSPREGSAVPEGLWQLSCSLDPQVLWGWMRWNRFKETPFRNSAHLPQTGGNQSTTQPRQLPAPLRAGPCSPPTDNCHFKAINKEKKAPRKGPTDQLKKGGGDSASQIKFMKP